MLQSSIRVQHVNNYPLAKITLRVKLSVQKFIVNLIMKHLFLLISYIFLISIVGVAQDKLTPELLFKLGRVGSPQISPNGTVVLYEVKFFSLEENNSKNYIYSVPINGGVATKLTNESLSAFNAKWRPDGKKINFLSASTGSVQLFEMNPDGSGVRQLSDINGGILAYKVSPSMTRIAYAAKVKLDESLNEIYTDLPKTTARIFDGLFYRHWDAWHDYTYNHIFISTFDDGKIKQGEDIMKDEKFDAPARPFGSDDEFNWSPDGKKLAYTCKKLHGTQEALSTNTDIFIYNAETKSTTNLTENYSGYDRYPQFSIDGKHIAWLSMRRAGNEADKNRLMVYYFDTKQTIEVTLLFDQTVNNFEWSNVNNNLYFTTTVEGTKQIYQAKEIGGKTATTYASVVPITKGDHDYTGFDVFTTADNKITRIIGNKQSHTLPSELFSIDAKGVEKQLTFTNKQITDKIKWGKVEKRWVTTTDNKKMLVWITSPPNMLPYKRYPALLYCQGGPQSPVSQSFSYRWNFQLMAANGFVVISPNRRGLPGFGSEWNDQIIGDYGGQAMRDLLTATDDAMTIPFVDRTRMGAVGASFGGFSVYWLAGNHNKRFKTFIAHCGMFNMESWYGSTEEMFFANNDNQGAYWNIPRPKNFDNSPHRFVKNWDAPILIIHNEKDYRVPLTQGLEAFTAAQVKGIKSKLLYFPDENHWVMKPQNSVLWQREFFEWLDIYLK